MTPPLDELLPPGRAEAIRAPLLQWFRREQRDLPWRRAPSPYAVWVSEMMLQQTQVATVIPYFERWMARFPTVESLAAAGEEEVLHAWEGLGYYSRARNLLRGAREVAARYGGRVPDHVPDLLALPGIGAYTAGAIASIAYNVRAPIVDGNVIRVLSRVFALRGDPARQPLRGRLWDLAAALVPEGEAREFNPGLMELGATVCTPLKPQCHRCPLEGACAARAAGIQEELPETAARPQVTPVHMGAALAWREGRVLLAQRREDESRWAGMWHFPQAERLPEESAADAAARAAREVAGLDVAARERATVVRHSVTRYRITLEAWHCAADEGQPRTLGCRDWRWVRPEDLPHFALPAAHRKIAERAATPESQLELSF